MKTIAILLATITTTLSIIPAAFAATDDFTNGYSNGLNQGQIDRQAKIFHIGTICEGQTDTWCVGYTDGYLDGFFQGGLPSSSSHIIIHEEHRGGGHEGGGHKGCEGGDNSTIVHCPINPPPPTCKKDCPGGGPPPSGGNSTRSR